MCDLQSKYFIDIYSGWFPSCFVKGKGSQEEEEEEDSEWVEFLWFFCKMGHFLPLRCCWRWEEEMRTLRVSGCLPLGWLQHSAGAYQCRGCSVPRKAGSKRWLGFLRTLEKGNQLTVLTSLSSLYVFCCRTLRKREIISGENIIFMFRYVEILFLL